MPGRSIFWAPSAATAAASTVPVSTNERRMIDPPEEPRSYACRQTGHPDRVALLFLLFVVFLVHGDRHGLLHADADRCSSGQHSRIAAARHLRRRSTRRADRTADHRTLAAPEDGPEDGASHCRAADFRRALVGRR